MGEEPIAGEKLRPAIELEDRIEEAKNETEDHIADESKVEAETKKETEDHIADESKVEAEAKVEPEEKAEPKMEPEEEPQQQQPGDNLGYLVQICAGKQHILHLTEEGHTYSYGSGIYGVCGQGGAACCFQHQILKSLSDRKVLQIACGEYHSLALTQSYDIYAWGRGFEGQLGIAPKGRAEIASKPTFIPFFDKLKVKCVAAGSYYSLAVSQEGELFGWGEARLGQLGCGKQSVVFLPQKISVRECPEDILRKSHSTISVKEKDVTPKSANPNPAEDYRIKKVAAGFGHTAAITEDGALFMWGLNVFGQLGIGEKRNIRWKPVRVEKDIANGWLPRVKDIACGYNFTFMIDESGKLYSWGKGYIGHNGLTEEDKPRRIESKTENREFTALICNDQAVVLFAPMRVYSVSPRCGPSCGGTVLSIIGTALKPTKTLKVRFTYGEKGTLTKEVEGKYVEQRYVDPRLGQDQAALQSIFCNTPRFDDEDQSGEKKEPEIKPHEKFPQKCKISITLDGIHYVDCDQDFLVYPANVKINNAHPKCGPVLGGTELVLMVDIDPVISNYLFNLCVGFQARPNGQGGNNTGCGAGKSKKGTIEEKGGELDVSKTIVRRPSRLGTITPGGASRLIGGGTQTSNGLQTGGANGPINPLEPTEQQLELDYWHCATATYDAGKIICQVPRLAKYDSENLQYNVDIALNGQQFSGYPIIFRYYGTDLFFAGVNNLPLRCNNIRSNPQVRTNRGRHHDNRERNRIL